MPTINIKKELYDKIIRHGEDATEYVNNAAKVATEKDWSDKS